MPYSSDTSGYLTLGQSAFGWITDKGGADGDWDLYSVYLQAGARYNFSSMGTSVHGVSGASHMYLELYDTNGDFISGYAPSIDGSVNTYYTPVLSGFYYVAASGDQMADVGGYRIAVSIAASYADDHGGEFWDATNVSSGRYYGVLERATDTDSFVLNAQLGKRYFYKVEQPAFDLFHTVDNDGHERLFGGASSDNSLVIITPTTSQAFQISFSSNTFVETGSYSFNLQTAFSLDKELSTGTMGDNTLAGNTTDDEIWGLEGNDTITANAGSDILVGGSGNDVLDGGAGEDTAGYIGNRAYYTARQNEDGSVVITDKRPDGDGQDTLVGIENFRFADMTLNLAGLLATNNHAPTDILLSNNAVLENASNETVVGTLSAVDADTGDTFHYSLPDSASGRFVLRGNKVVVADSSKLDFEEAQSHQIKVRVRDAGGDSFEKTFSIRINDVAVEILKGTKGKDLLKGGSGSDKLYGGLGNDVLTGGAGKDIFVFDTKPNKKTNLDTITDFNVKDDTIWLDNAVFKKLGKGSEAKPG
ncbi:M10 family metallopeptidase C-terminal domain-containing protein, partial [Microvirga sp. 2TAF3]|uniref:M10 family metallopeptidase C-terminal domain-containing protein n=1 Tax=Microvirga sp. 2TAF3 TaxID=3233014 RepID=UPI003F98342C